MRWVKAVELLTRMQRAAAARARHFAEKGNWPLPMALDDDRLDDPAYRPPSNGWKYLPAVLIG
jgi:hypothetical protein